jgi:hypothetical protein
LSLKGFGAKTIGGKLPVVKWLWLWLEAWVLSRLSSVLSCIGKHQYQAMNSEDLVLVVVTCQVCILVKVLQLFVVSSYEHSINLVISPNLVSIH